MSLWNALPAEEEEVLADPGEPAAPISAEDQDERGDLHAYRQAGHRARARRLGAGALGLAALVVLWQILAMIISDPVFLPSVSQTAASFAHYLPPPSPSQGKPLWYDAATSLRRVLIGFAAGAAIGVALGAG